MTWRGLVGILMVGAAAVLLYRGWGGGSEGGGTGDIPEAWHFSNRGELPSLVGQPMPAIKVGNWLNNRKIGAEEMKGKIIVVDLWATWCGPCIASIPHNNALQRKYGKSGVMVLGICTANNHERMTEVAKATGMEYFCGEDVTLETQTAWKVPFYPTYCVVDRKGIVRAAGLSPEGVDLVVEKLLAKK